MTQKEKEFSELIKGLSTEQKIALLGILRSVVDSRDKGELRK